MMASKNCCLSNDSDFQDINFENSCSSLVGVSRFYYLSLFSSYMYFPADIGGVIIVIIIFIMPCLDS